MLQEGKGPINFTVFLTLFGEKLNGESPVTSKAPPRLGTPLPGSLHSSSAPAPSVLTGPPRSPLQGLPVSLPQHALGRSGIRVLTRLL